MQKSTGKHETKNYVELCDRMTTIERQMNAGSGEAKEKALLAKDEANILEVQSSIGSARTCSSPLTLARWSKGESSPVSSGSFTGGGSYDKGADP
eukprot:8102755-Pyramimonas_sp.AAC.1